MKPPPDFYKKEKENDSLSFLYIRNLFFTILQPGIVAGLIPLLICEKDISEIFDHFGLFRHYAGSMIFLTGLFIMLWCIVNFTIKGRGTLSPLDPTQKLVINGLYQYTRNPMYVGVILILMGEALYSQSTILWFYSIFVFFAFHLFIIYFEEPRLIKDFGEEYKTYCEKVRRWF